MRPNSRSSSEGRTGPRRTNSVASAWSRACPRPILASVRAYGSSWRKSAFPWHSTWRRPAREVGPRRLRCLPADSPHERPDPGLVRQGRASAGALEAHEPANQGVVAGVRRVGVVPGEELLEAGGSAGPRTGGPARAGPGSAAAARRWGPAGPPPTPGPRRGRRDPGPRGLLRAIASATSARSSRAHDAEARFRERFPGAPTSSPPTAARGPACRPRARSRRTDPSRASPPTDPA